MAPIELQRRAQSILRKRESQKAERLAKEIVGYLNRGLLHGLNGLVESWIAAGYRLDRWERREIFERQLSDRVLVPQQDLGAPVRFRVKWSHFERSARILENIIQTGDQKSKAEAMKALLLAPSREATDYIQALELFSDLITGPYYDKIGRCPRCQRFFVNTSGRSDKTYCSQTCASAMSAKKAVKERRQQEHQDNLDKVHRALDKFLSLSSEGNVSRRDWIAQRTGLTGNFVTRALRELGKA